MANSFSKADNLTLLDAFFDDEMKKQAEAGINEDFLPTRAREGAIFREILPPQTIGYDELQVQIGVEAPVWLFEVEPYVPPAVTIPFGTETETLEIAGNRALVKFHRIGTVKHRKTKQLLATYQMNLRKVLTEYDLNEILSKEDSTIFAMIDTMLGTVDTTPSWAEGPLNKNITGTLTTESFKTAMNILPRNGPNNGFRCKTVVMNTVLAEEVTAWDGFEISQTMMEDIEERGFVRGDYKGRNIVITIKQDVVAGNEMYMFAAPKYLGYFLILEDTQMFSDAHGHELEWWSEETIGVTLQGPACAKATFSGHAA